MLTKGYRQVGMDQRPGLHGGGVFRPMRPFAKACDAAPPATARMSATRDHHGLGAHAPRTRLKHILLEPGPWPWGCRFLYRTSWPLIPVLPRVLWSISSSSKSAFLQATGFLQKPLPLLLLAWGHNHGHKTGTC